MHGAPLLVALLGLVLIASAREHAALLIYNHSPSVPTGFYLRSAAEPGRGDLVTLPVPEGVRAYALQRQFGDADDRFLKRVAAIGGQRVCARDNEIEIDGRVVARRREADHAGHELPTWSGCRTLRAEEFFLLGDTPESFDGRYWGVTQHRDIEAVWRKLGS